MPQGLSFRIGPYGTISFVYFRAWTGLGQRKNLLKVFRKGKVPLFSKWIFPGNGTHESVMGSPPHLAMMWVSIVWVHGAVRGDCRQKQHESFFPLPLVFLVSTNSLQRFWGLVVWMLRIGTATHPGPGLRR